jgi:predicted RNA-binding Zn-ribbon protein involved in translation (DUF1610 family)
MPPEQGGENVQYQTTGGLAPIRRSDKPIRRRRTTSPTRVPDIQTTKEGPECLGMASRFLVRRGRRSGGSTSDGTSGCGVPGDVVLRRLPPVEGGEPLPDKPKRGRPRKGEKRPRKKSTKQSRDKRKEALRNMREHRREVRNQLANAGLCTTCHHVNPNIANNRFTCPTCKKKNLFFRRNRRRAWRAEGRCGNCGFPSPDTHHCNTCAQKLKKHAKQYQRKQKQIQGETL